MLSNKKDFYRYAGDPLQVCGIKEYQLLNGKAKGVRAFDVKNGSGLEFTVLPDRCLDFSSLSFKGVNCTLLGKTGVTTPDWRDTDNFFRGFYAGFLTTCGLRNVGGGCEDAGEKFGIHGRISNIPAEDVCASTEWVDGVPEMTISGRMRESAFFAENMMLERKIVCRYGENKFRICNTVENIGFRPEKLMYLMHFNMGYPFLDEGSYMMAETKKLLPRDPEAENGVNDYFLAEKPQHAYAEQVFYHELFADAEGRTMVAFVNPKLEIALSLSFSKKQFPLFTHWKQMGEGEYVFGMEPCNCYVGGRGDARNEGLVTEMEPFEKRQFDVEVTLYDGKAEIRELEAYMKKNLVF